MHKFDEMTEPELKRLFQDLAAEIARRLPPNTGFILLASPFDDASGRGGIAQYVSNIERVTAAAMMVETIHRWAPGAPEDPTLVPRVGT